ncbi:hypothetical protein L914_13237 [Phytophthora nicotianae]|uniref:Uncharacterized protein n=1 Tax=Phytophthora nicotianae TaxID=4792 RepID=W2MX64_PHYNI|nr:hypothetical protein L914_13237 [Phytophthora nicotianae]
MVECTRNAVASVVNHGRGTSGPATTELHTIRQACQNVRDSRRTSKSAKETANLTEVCPVEALVLAGVWWNFEPTYYYLTDNGTICHAVVPQYNSHGNYFIGGSKVVPYRTAPSSCENDSFPFEVYFYHASIGFYSLYEGETGTYCTKDRTSYIQVDVLGSYDINGSFLAKDTGSTKSRVSYWYSIVGALWLGYRVLMVRRSCVLCSRYGRRCDDLGETLSHEQAVVFVQESLRLSAHGASNYQRTALLYLIVEGIMTDLFLIIANDGWAARLQYASLGYNLSGLMLLLFEMVESMNWLSEKWRMRIKRVFFSYEVALVVGLEAVQTNSSRGVLLLVEFDLSRNGSADYCWNYLVYACIVCGWVRVA